VPYKNYNKSSNRNSPYFCDPDTFTTICEMERRRADRDWHSAYISRINIQLDSSQPEDLADISYRLEEVLQQKIRQSDTVCRWDEDCYFVLLHDLTDDDIAKVKNRIGKYFKKSISSCPEADCWFNNQGTCQERSMPERSGCDCRPPVIGRKKVALNWDFYPLQN